MLQYLWFGLVQKMEANKEKDLKDKKTKEEKEKIKKSNSKKDTARFKDKYFEFYDDIKISDRQDW